jgi:hypothetical protein
MVFGSSVMRARLLQVLLEDNDGGFAAKRLPLAPSLQELHIMVVAAFGLAPTTKLQYLISDKEDPFINSGRILSW